MSQFTSDFKRWTDAIIPGWCAFFLYFEFISSTFSIAGTELAHAMMLLAFVVFGLFHPGRSSLPLWAFAPFLALLGSALLSGLFNSSLGEFLPRIGQDYRIFIVPFLVLFALKWVDTRRLMRVFLVAVLAVSVFGIVQHYFGVERIHFGDKTPLGIVDGRFRSEGFFDNPLTYSGYLLIVAPVFLSLAWGESSRWRWGFLAGGVLAGTGVIFSLTRSGVIGLGVGILILCYRFNRKFTLFLVGIVAITGGAFSIAHITGVMPPPSPEVMKKLPVILKRMYAIDLRTSSVLSRVYLWEAALLGYRDKPVLGFGLNSHGTEMVPYQIIVSDAHGGFDLGLRKDSPVHNAHLRVLFELGTVGIIVYLWLWGTLFAWNRIWLLRDKGASPWESSLLWGIAAGLAGSLTAGIFEDNLFDAEVQTVITMMIGLSLHAGMEMRKKYRQAT